MTVVCSSQDPHFKRLADALGLPMDVTNATLEMRALECLFLKVERFVTQSEADALSGVFETMPPFRLVEETLAASNDGTEPTELW